MSISTTGPDRRSIRVALAAALLREGVATTRVSEKTQVPFALVEFLAEHPERSQRPERGNPAVDYVDPSRPWATMAISTPQQHPVLAWRRVRLLLAAFSHCPHRHRPQGRG